MTPKRWTIIPWRCPECGETERTGPLSDNPGYEDGEQGHCAECLDNYDALSCWRLLHNSVGPLLANEHRAND